ncbi:MAG: PKD domain-containing protein, partial [Pseudomonadota bacterium]
VEAQFAVSTEQPKALEKVTFNGQASAQGSADRVVEYHWDFGDGTKAIESAPVVFHNFQRAGKYVVSLTVVTASGARAEVVKRVAVGFRLQLEHEPRCPLVCRPARFVAKAFVNIQAEDKIVEYLWSLGGSGELDHKTEDGEITHLYEEPGTYKVKVRATSVLGVVEEAVHSVTVVEMTST